MSFNIIGKAVAQQFQAMSKHGLFRVQVDKDQLWDTYLASFPEGSNPMYRQRTEHDCQCCKHFIRAVGGVVSIIGGKLVTLWDLGANAALVGSPYLVVANAMAVLVKSCAIDNVFLHNEATVGTAKSFEQLVEGVQTWEHYYINLPAEYVMKGELIGPKTSDTRSTHDVMLRSLKEITTDAIETVLDMISQNSLYRGEEHMFAVESFQKLKAAFEDLPGSPKRRDLAADLFVWSQLKIPASVSRIRSTVIGTLLVDLSEGKDLEDAVKMYESKVAPTNYKRPTALVTKAMIQKAQAKIEELGFTSALERRYATIDDITINNILFADRAAKKVLTGNVFDELVAAVPEKVKSLDKVEEVSIDKFISDILPKAQSLEVMFENRQACNLVSLIAPVDPTAKNMFKWGNNFSWSYAGELADSIKERVKRAGGKVDGDFRASLSWYNYDDLDLHLIEPDKNEIFFGRKTTARTGGQLDVDMNAGSGTSRSAVENITYPTRSRMLEGMYKLFVNNYSQRETANVGFEVELEFDGVVHSFAYAPAVRNGTNVIVAEFKYTHKNGIEIVKSLPSSQTGKLLWNVGTQIFHKVNVVMLSPNHWDGKPVGNKHYFFMLDGCLNEGKARGFFNEFLTDKLNEHRKVFEVVGSKMKTDESDRQLSGLGFSSTQRNHLFCRVKGSFSRTVKVVF